MRKIFGDWRAKAAAGAAMLALVSGCEMGSVDEQIREAPVVREFYGSKMDMQDSWNPARIGVNRWAGYAPLDLAAEDGIFSGDEAIALPMVSTRQALSKFEMGHLDAIGATLEEALWLAGRGKAFRIAMILDISDGADAILSKPGVGLEQLRGKRVGMERFGPGERMIDEALSLVGMRSGDIEKTHVAGDQLLRELASGRVAAAAVFEPEISELEEMGFQRLFDSARMDAKIADALLVSEAALANPEKKAGICAAIRGHLLETKAIRKDPAVAARKVGAMRGEDPRGYERAWKTIRFPSWAESEKLLADPGSAKRWAAAASAAMGRPEGALPIPEFAFGGIGCPWGPDGPEGDLP